MIKKHWMLLTLALLPAGAGAADLGGGDITGVWTRLAAEGRTAGLAGAMTSVDNGLGSVDSNPAGLASLGRLSASFGYLAWMADTSMQTLGVGQPLGPGVAAISVKYFNAGSMNRLVAPTYGSPPVIQGMINSFFLSAGLHWAQVLGPMQWGLGLHVIQQQLDSSGSISESGDLGLRLLTPLRGVSVAASFMSLGPPLQGAPQPGELRVGAAYQSPDEGWIMVSMDYEMLRRDPSAGQLNLGTEVRMGENFALRAGLRGGLNNAASGFAAGASFFLEPISLNYAVQSLGDFGNCQMISLDYAFGSKPESEQGAFGDVPSAPQAEPTLP